MKADCLIIGNARDPHVAMVAAKLAGQGLANYRIDQTDLASLDLAFRPEQRGFLANGELLEGVRLIWLRRFHPGRVGGLSAADEDFARKEYTSLLLGALASYEAEWHSPPYLLTMASYKPLQLSLAHRHTAFRIPSTLITSSPDQAAEFIGEVGAPCVIKSVGGHVIEHEDGFEPIFTSLVSENVRDNLGLLTLSPCIIQRFIPRKFDARVNVIGNAVFGTKIDASQVEGASTDYRRVYYTELPHAPMELPETVSAGCFELCRRLGLSYGAFDFAVSQDDEWYFLEVNPWGQWAWIEEMTGQPLSQAFADLFSARVRALRADAASRPRKRESRP